MTNQERWAFYESGEFRQTLAVQLLDWAGYWAKNGLNEITDPLQKMQTRRAIDLTLQDISYVLRVIASLVITDDTIKASRPEDITEQMIYNAMVYVMANELEWVTGVSELPESFQGGE